MSEAKSSSITIAPILSCLNVGTDCIEERHATRPRWVGGQIDEPTFRCNNVDGDRNKQNDFFDQVYPLADDVARIPEIESIADGDVDVINSFLRARGFSIQLEPFMNPASIGVASFMHLLSRWTKPGTPWTVYSEGRRYPGARIKDDVSFYQEVSGPHSHPVACLLSNNGDKYFITSMDNLGVKKSTNEVFMMNLVNTLENRLERTKDYGAVVFPKIDFQEEPDISWLCGANEQQTGLGYYIRQALQETKLKMDHIGAEVKSAAAMEFAVSGCCLIPDAPRPDLVINKPFLMWVRREGVRFPLFIGHMCQDCWKDPNASSQRSFI